MTTEHRTDHGIAIIGLAGRFPKARNVEQFWRNLCDGVEAISFFTDEELQAAGVAVPQAHPNYVKARGILDEADLFDAAFFGVNPREAEVMDPQHRVFLECAWEALEKNQSVRDLCATRFKDFHFGLKLIAQNSGQREFQIDTDAVKEPDKVLSDWVVKSYQGQS